MYKIVVLLFLLLTPTYLFAESVADSHTEMAGCESCHENGEPSADMAFENATCAECHGTLAELEGVNHKLHVDILICNDCHVVHVDESAETSCANCH